MVHRLLIALLVLPLLVGCGVAASDFEFEIAEVVGDVESDNVEVQLVVRNGSQREVSICSAKIIVQIKGDDLVSFILDEKVAIAPTNTTTTATRWSVQKDDPTTLYAMRRHPIERYLDRLTFAYEVSIEGATRRARTFKHKGLKAEDLDINFEKLLR